MKENLKKNVISDREIIINYRALRNKKLFQMTLRWYLVDGNINFFAQFVKFMNNAVP